jgi:hypothetical protein
MARAFLDCWRQIRRRRELVHIDETREELQLRNSLHEGHAWSCKMIDFANALSRISRIQIEVEALEMIVAFCGIGLAVSLLLASSGLDSSTGLF